MANKKSKNQAKHVNTLETDNFSSKLINTVKNDLLSPAPGDFISQLLGKYSESAINPEKKQQMSGDLAPGQELDLSQKSEAKKANPDTAPGIDYHRDIVRSSERSLQKESHGIAQKIRPILDELARIQSSIKVLETKFRAHSVEQMPVNVGTYHENFFEWVLALVKETRRKVEDSGAFLAKARGKAGKKGLIQKSWEEGNTSVTMSNERGVATQTG